MCTQRLNDLGMNVISKTRFLFYPFPAWFKYHPIILIQTKLANHNVETLRNGATPGFSSFRQHLYSRMNFALLSIYTCLKSLKGVFVCRNLPSSSGLKSTEFHNHIPVI